MMPQFEDMTQSGQSTIGCVPLHAVEKHLRKEVRARSNEICLLHSGQPPKSHWGKPISNSGSAPEALDNAVLGIVAHLMERLIWPTPPYRELSNRLFLLRDGKAYKCLPEALFLCDPAVITPPLPPLVLDPEYESTKPKHNVLCPDQHAPFVPDEAKTFRLSVASQFAIFGSNRHENHPFLNRDNWTIRNDPKLFLALHEQYDGDELIDNHPEYEDLKRMWTKLKPFRGAELAFRMPSGSKKKPWLRASEICRKLEPELNAILRKTLPRKGSVAEHDLLEYLYSLRRPLAASVQANVSQREVGQMLGTSHKDFVDTRIDVAVSDSRIVRRIYQKIKKEFE